jgi:uncharacterized FlgJ-related protein
MFSNKYIFNYFLPNKLYTSQCLDINDSVDLPSELALFFNKQNQSNTILPIVFNKFPKYIGNLTQVDKKNVFAHILLPMLNTLEEDINKDRDFLLRISAKMLEKPLESNDFKTINALAKKYDVVMVDYNFWDYVVVIEELLKRVNIVPSSVMIAILAYETNWGIDTYFLFHGYFDYVVKYFFKPKKSLNHSNLIFESSYFNLEDALKYYYKKINTSSNYANFRYFRYISNFQDINHLVKLGNMLVAVNHNESVNMLGIIRDNKLMQYDGLIYGDAINNSCLNIG